MTDESNKPEPKVITGSGDLKAGRAVVSGTGSLKLTGHPATVTVSRALESAGVDYKATLEFIRKLSAHERRALEDKVITPVELKVPKPDGYTDERHVDLCATFSASLRSDSQLRWTRGIAVAGVVVALIAAFL